MTRVHSTESARLRVVGDSLKEDLRKFAEDVRTGLTAPSKHLPCRYIYDHEGSLLFEQICELPEYYLTRAEREILDRQAGEIDALLRNDVALVELGSGSSTKTRILIGAMLKSRGRLHYVPVDVSREMLESTAAELIEQFPGLEITAFAGDYRQGIRFAHEEVKGPKCFLWLGSSMGNFDRPDAVEFLQWVAGNLDPEDCLIVGLDLRKDPEVMERAYNDSQGVTAAFSKNILVRINRELGGNFDLDKFHHRPRFNDTVGRVESHLVSEIDQRVRIEASDLEVDFAAGESIHAENSYKYREREIDEVAREAGLRTRHRWLDGKKRFSLNLLVHADHHGPT